jgi:hypothetical protein
VFTLGPYLEELALATVAKRVIDLLVLLRLHLHEHEIARRERADTSVQQVVLGVKLEQVRVHRRLGDALVNLHRRIVSPELRRQLRDLEQHVVGRRLLVLARKVVGGLPVSLERIFLVVLAFVHLSNLLLELCRVREATGFAQHDNRCLEVVNRVYA